VQVREKLAELQALERQLSAFVNSCDAACVGGAALDCTILEDLGSSGEAQKKTASPASGTATRGCCG